MICVSPEMWVDVSGHGSGSAPLELVRVSPVGNKLAGDLSAIQLEGDISANVQLHIPLKKNSPWKTRVDGTLQISNNALQLPRWNIDFEKLQGQAKFDRFGLKAEQLSAVFSGTDVDLDVAIGESVEEEGLRLTTSVTGQLSASQFAQLYPPIQDLAMRIEGQSPWQVELGLGENGAPGRLHLSSNLVGTQLYLPQPLSKNMDTPLSFTLDSVFPLDDQPIALQLGTKTQAILRVLPQGFAANITFDAGEPEIPQSPGVMLQGNVATLDWSDWVSDLPELFPAGSNQTVELRHADLVIQALNAFGRTFPDVHMVLDRDGTEYAVVIDAEHSRGNLRVPVEVNSSTTISGQFQSLFWPESEGNASTVDHPRDMPSLNLVSDQTLWGDLDLGQVQIATYPTPNGLEVDNFEARSQALHIKGSGSWLRNANGDISQFSARMTAEDGGVLLRKLGFESYLVGGQTIAEMDVRWPGTLAAMDAKRMNGRLSLEIGQGKIPDLDTGAGRLLGLVSLQALPRRLSLDFSDLFETGLVFDRIEGALQLRSGDIYTDDLLLVGPTADILIAGRIGLVQRDYELLAKVRPKVGGALSIFGAIAGGGVGAAAMMLFGNALNDPYPKQVKCSTG